MLTFILANDSDYIALGGQFIVFDTTRSCFAFGCTVWNDWTILSDAAILKQIMAGNMIIDIDDDDGMYDVVSVEKQPSEVNVGSKKTTKPQQRRSLEKSKKIKRHCAKKILQ